MSKLFYVIGASGAGKDTLINYVRERINGAEKVIFAHRYITRPATAGPENHISLSRGEFLARREANLFALHWESHGNYYGIGQEINVWMRNGFHVVVNGSREYLPLARLLYPDLIAVLVTASEETISRRLELRGRENAAEIKSRIARTSEISVSTENCIKIQNDDTIEQAGSQLINLICIKQKLYI